VVNDIAARELVDRWPAGHSLPAGLHLDPEVFALELDRVWGRSWLFACHSCELPEPGDWITLEVAADPIAIVRGEDGELRGFHDVCRHRGARVCGRPSGHGRRLVCPYHQWTYDLDGRVRSCGGMDVEGLVDPERHSLLPVHVEEVGGIAFVNLAHNPEAFGPARDDFAAALAPHGLERAAIAVTREYEVAAGWKLIVENNRECWHCHAGHPEYRRANFDTANGADPATRAAIAARTADAEAGLALAGVALAVDHADAGLAAFPSPDRWWSATRTPLAEGFVTESLDGQPVAPLMGDFARHDVGTLRLRSVPSFWCHLSGDHAVSTRLLPVGPQRTRVRVQWLVDRDAVAGTDYDPERLLPFWERTSEQDWGLCERNQIGLRSSAYRPGPLSPDHEANVMAFHAWYVDRLLDEGSTD
jgi:glycine betaine catabolism A